MLIAHVSFIGPDKGGRLTPPQSGYHPQADVGGIYTSCAIESVDDETIFDFDTMHRVSLQLLFPDLYQDKFTVGSAVHFYEGSHFVGSGTILEVR